MVLFFGEHIVTPYKKNLAFFHYFKCSEPVSSERKKIILKILLTLALDNKMNKEKYI